MPALFCRSLPSFPMVMIDEYQDLSPSTTRWFPSSAEILARSASATQPAIYEFRGGTPMPCPEPQSSLLRTPPTSLLRCPLQSLPTYIGLSPTFVQYVTEAFITEEAWTRVQTPRSSADTTLPRTPRALETLSPAPESTWRASISAPA